MVWPTTVAELIEAQRALAVANPEPWRPGPLTVGGCFVCFPRGHTGIGAAGDPAWAAAVLLADGRRVGRYVVRATARGPYQAGLLALREGPLLEAAVRGLPRLPDVLLVNATGRDHPRRAGLAIHLGAELGVPTVGVTHRPLLATGEWPEPRAGAASPLFLEGELVGYWLRPRAAKRPIVVHPGWRVDPETALNVVRRCCARWRTPEPLRLARRAARTARARSG
ncbi:endonuclease V [Carbonactinospora thermoautotrophica]|uniref:endonuclease V n=1 Tax=Carbonactinospora thermoautotrophica TaxID=1469144 RepID=UPI002270330A|nr:endonuclease V [Carbonactinospora thermoautotrophica]MCX9193825.1 endonuclease V [Carbonactinospora thermoautotrophica]